MFYSEEDIEPAVQIAKELFGPVGNMLEGSRFVAQNVVIGSSAYGKLWYGDVEGTIDYVNELCEILGKRINQKVSIVGDQF